MSPVVGPWDVAFIVDAFADTVIFAELVEVPLVEQHARRGDEADAKRVVHSLLQRQEVVRAARTSVTFRFASVSQSGAFSASLFGSPLDR